MGIEEQIKQRALELGFDLAGVAPVDPGGDLNFARRWAERGWGGEMRYLENPQRFNLRCVLPSVRSVVCVGLVYNAPLPYSEEVRSQESEVRKKKSEFRCRSSRGEGREPGAEQQEPNPESPTPNPEPRAWISRYAWGRDYHELMRGKLEALRKELEKLAPGAETRVYVDTGPVVERALARYSGIGWTGKNTCLINEGKGSWFFLGVLLSNLALRPDLSAPDRCGSCKACLEACPTGALVEPYVMDASRCIAYLNIELKGPIPESFRAAMGANVFGCDICQDVCPWNGEVKSQKSEARSRKDAGHPAATTAQPEFQPLTLTRKMETGKWKFENGKPKIDRSHRSESTGRHEANHQSSVVNGESFSEPRIPNPESRSFSLFNPELEFLASLSEEDFRRAFRHSPLRRAKYRGWLRNLCVAMGNSGDPRFAAKLRELARHSDPLVREHAAWALKQLEELTNLPTWTEGR